MLWLAIIIATLAIQIPNIWAINKFSENPSLNQAFIIAIVCIPTSIISTTGFAYFYGKGFDSHSYPVLSIAAYGISLLCSFAIQGFLLKTKSILPADIISVFFVLLGLLAMIFRDEISRLIKF